MMASSMSVRRFTYKPLILRVPGLIFICALAVALIAALEYAARTLPMVEKTTYLRDISHIAARSVSSEPITSTTIPGAYLPTAISTVESVSSEPIASTTIPGAYLPTAISTVESVSSEPITSTTIPGAYLPTAISTVKSVSSEPITLSTNPSAYLSTANSVSTENPHTTKPETPTILFSTSSRAYLPTDGTSTPTSSVVPSSVYLPTATKVLVSAKLSTDTSGHVTTISSTYTTVESGPAMAMPTNSTDYGSPKFQTVMITWPLWWIFAAGYLPLLLAILIKIFWTSVIANVKLIEPFMQLSKPGGAPAKDVLHNFYLSSNLTPDPILACFQRRWLIFWTSCVYLIVGLLGPLASEVLFLDIHYGCGNDTCLPPKLSADATILRLLQGLLSFIAVMALTIMILLHYRETGVYSNPSSIASIACLLNNQNVLRHFKNLPDNISSKDLEARLGNTRYQLGRYQLQDGAWRYGISPVPQAYSSDLVRKPVNQGIESNKQEKKWSHNISNFLDFGFILFILGLLGVVVTYFLDASNSGFNRFFNSNAFGPRFFMSLMGTLIAMYWKSIERRVQTLTPFRRLIQSPAPAQSTILFRRHSLPPLVLYTCLVKGHFFAALVALTTFLADLLTISLSVIPYSPSEIYLELLICSYTSMGILALMVLVIIGLLFWQRELNEMPRKPDTLAAVMSYLCDSHLLVDFEGCESLTSAELEKRIGRAGKMYGFGKFVGEDGQRRWMVDEDGIVS